MQPMKIAENDVPVFERPAPSLTRTTHHRSSNRRADTSNLPVVSLALMQRAEGVAAVCKEAGLVSVRPVAVGPTIENAVYYPVEPDWSMVVVPSRLDPSARSNGSFPVPGDVARQLKKVSRAGIDFDQTYIAHELSGRPLGESALELTSEQAGNVVAPPPPSASSVKLARHLDRVGLAARATLKMAGRAALAGSSAAVAVLALPLLDPAVFGVLVDEEDGTGIWFGVTSWVW